MRRFHLPEQTTNNQLFAKKKNLEMERPGAGGLENNATLPADWKHGPKHKGKGACGIDRSYSYSNSLGKYYNTDDLKGSACTSSTCSVSSGENPYATIRDLPSLGGKHGESSYMEMTSPVGGQDGSYAEIGLFAESGKGQPEGGSGARGTSGEMERAPQDPPSHYDSPKNSHIPSHYDLPPVRHYPPSPTFPRQQHR
ncbi:multiple epidermal growth factor-like domains protein 10 [Cetorhinus maximus]